MKAWTRSIAVATAAVGMAVNLSATAQDKSAFSEAQRSEIEQVIRSYLLDNPDILNEMVDALQAKQEQEQAAKQKAVIDEHRAEIFNPPEGTVIGNLKGDVTLVEFFDYNCGYCKSMFPAVMDVLNDDGKVRLVLKELPILGPASEVASKAALAARAQGKYSEMHQALLGHKGSLSESTIFQIAEDIGLDVDQLRDDMKDDAITKIIDRNRDLARDLQVTGTPAMFVGDEFFPGAMGRERLEAAVADARN